MSQTGSGRFPVVNKGHGVGGVGAVTRQSFLYN